MQIKKNQKSALRNAQVALTDNEERLISSMNTADGYGTTENPYSMSDMCEMIKNGTWQGGYVLFMGKVEYIEKDQFVLGEIKEGSSDYTIVANDDDTSEFEEPPYLDPNLPLYKPSSDFDISQAGQSSESSNSGSNIAIVGTNYNVYHDVISVTTQCKLSLDQTVFEKWVLVSISTFDKCYESDIPTISCALQTTNNFVLNTIYQSKSSSSSLNRNTLIANFGYYRVDGQTVLLIINGDRKHPIYITTY